MNYDFDIAVIGGGAAGLFAASVANFLGAKTCILEKDKLGGECTWTGCIPSKALIRSAHLAHLFKRSSKLGIKFAGKTSLSTDKVISHVHDIVKEISLHHTPETLERRGIKILFGSPRFKDERTIESNGKSLKAKRYIICTGTRPAIPPIEGLKDIDYLTNENIFSLDNIPSDLIILGGGPIGIELAQAIRRLGSKVTVVEMLDRILPQEDEDIVSIVESELKYEGVNMLTGKKAVKIEKIADRISLTLTDEDGKTENISSNDILIATGRKPNVENLSLEKASVEYTKKGICTNMYLQTTNGNIFACGDVVGPYMFSHVAAYQAGICARNALFRKIAWQRTDYRNIAWATFTTPEIAHLGLTEKEARSDFRKINIYKTDYDNSDRAVTDLHKNGRIKVLTDNKGRILGAHIAGAGASEIMHGFLIAKSLKIGLSKLASLVFIYPTLSELVKKTAAKSLKEKAGNSFIRFFLRVLRS